MGTVSGGTGEPTSPSVAPWQTRHDLDEQRMRDRLRDSLFDEPPPVVRVGRYELLEKIGSGGLGVVYAAYDPELDRKVALKLVQRQQLGAEATSRMQREAQAMAKVNHPHVVTVHDVGPHGDGVFIAMELVEGVTMSRWLRAKERSWKEVRDVLVQAGEGLIAAHEQGLVHRDFKPANVLIDARGRPHVLDFGLARAAEIEAPTPASVPSLAGNSMLDLELTRTGMLLGTPAYMAPEQFAGLADTRTDQWAFCVTAYEAFYGHRPFQAASAPELQRAIQTGQLSPTPPLGPTPAWLYKAIVRGLSVDPGGRHPSMPALLQALQKDRRSRRMQWLSALGALMLIGSTAGVTTWLVKPEPTDQARAEVERLEEQARAAAAEGRFVYPPASKPEAPTAWVSINNLESLDGPVTPEARAKAQALREEFAQALAAIGDRYYEQEGGMSFASDYYAAALLFDADHPRARERSSLTPGALAALERKATEVEFTEAELIGAEPLAALAAPDPETRKKKLAQIFRGKKAPAASTSLQVERLLGRDAPAVFRRPDPAAATTNKSNASTAASSADESEHSSASSSSASDKPSRSDREAARAEAEKGRAAAAAGRYDEAEQAFHRALGKDRRNVVALEGLSDLYFERGAYQKALKYARQAVAVAPRKASLRMQLGDTLFKVHHYEEARAEYTAAKKLGHPGAVKALANLEDRIGSG